MPGSPTSYIYDGQVRQMTSRKVTVTVQERERRAGGAHAHALRLAPWLDPDRHPRPADLPVDARDAPASIGDANAGNFRYLNHFFEVNQAQSVDELEEAIVAQPGRARGSTRSRPTPRATRCYADISVVPHVTNEKATTCNTVARDARPSPRSGCRCSTARCRPASGAPTPTRSSPASSARPTCRSCAAATTS